MKKNYLNAQTQIVEMEIDNAIMGTSWEGIQTPIGEQGTEPVVGG